jgi:peptidoglycan/xylan/chitin deacetylase (PgdA/CDA1 family)
MTGAGDWLMDNNLGFGPEVIRTLHTKDIDGFAWPDGKKCAVAISWHVDGEAGPVGRDERSLDHLGALSEAAYGVITATPRILEMHGELGIPATFFIPGYTAELHPDVVLAIVRAGHEVAHHGWLHENVFPLNEEQEREALVKGAEALSRITGKKPVGWSAPGWGIKASTVELLSEMGMLYDSSLMDRDMPYIIGCQHGGLVELPISTVLDDYAMFGASLYPPGNVVSAPAETAFQIWKEEFDGLYHYGGLFTTTFHPNLTGRPGRLRMMYRLLRYMRSFDDVWWATCEDMARYVRSVAG